MLQIQVGAKEFYDESTETFIQTKPTTLNLEHSLLSISKWESHWHKPFLTNGTGVRRTNEEIIDYIKCMTLNKNVPDEVYKALTRSDFDKVTAYIEDSMTATTIHSANKSITKEIITSEIIYYWMITYSIPFTCEKWHINRLITLIQVCSAKSNPKKMPKKDVYRQYHELNKARRKALGTKG